MYTEQDFAAIRAQKMRRMIITIIPVILLSAAAIYCAALRLQALTMILTIIAGGLGMFMYGLFVKPVSAYYQHMDQVMHGRVRTLTGAFKQMDDFPALRDGVYYYSMLINVGKMEDEEDDRLLYYDANLPRPDWKQGDMLTVTYHDKALGSWVRA